MLLLLHTVQGIDTRCSVGEVGRGLEGERTGGGEKLTLPATFGLLIR